MCLLFWLCSLRKIKDTKVEPGSVDGTEGKAVGEEGGAEGGQLGKREGEAEGKGLGEMKGICASMIERKVTKSTKANIYKLIKDSYEQKLT